MKTTVGYKVKFFYTKRADGRVETHCHIIDKDKVVSTGIAVCSKQDNFNKNTGRKLALTRAVSYLDKVHRALIWNDYFIFIGKVK